jgi:protein-S-isoprenylcysteine O-methyltransferase Ste14
MLKVARIELIVCWILYFGAFIVRARKPTGRQAVIIAPAGKWGVILQGAAFAILFSFLRPKESGLARTIASMVLAPLAVLCAFSAIRHLGKQWRIQAGLIADHELIQTGPYAMVRHPIYASLLSLLLATGLLITWWPALVAAVAVFIAATEIRVHAEDGLLADRFGEAFAAYKSRVRAYLPFVR